MKRFIESENRGQGALLPEHLDDYVGQNNPVRIVDVFVDSSIWKLSISNAYNQQGRGDLLTTPQYFPSSISTATLTEYSPADDWKERPGETSS